MRAVVVLLLAVVLSLHAQIGTTGAMVGRSARVVGPSFPVPSSSWLVTLAGSGQTVADSSGSNNGTLGADSGSSTDDPTWATEGLSFDGGDFVNLGEIYGTAFTTTASSVSVAFSKSTTTNNHLVSRASTSGVGWTVDLTTANVVGFRVLVTATSNDLNFNATNTLSNGTWYHACMAIPATPTVANSEIYVNGSLATDATTADTLSSDPSYTAVNFNIGARGNGNQPFVGSIGVVRFWSGTELTAAQCAAVCNADKAIMATRSVTLTCP